MPLEIYPNPANDNIHINYDGEVSSVEIADMYGAKQPASVNNNVIDISGLRKGIYILKVNSDKEIFVVSFIKL